MLVSQNSNMDISIRIVKLLIGNSANVNLLNRYGSATLILALYNLNTSGSIEIVKLLIKNGANTNLQNNNSNIALMFASITSGSTEFV